MKSLYLIVLATGCAPTLSAGYDAMSSMKGPVHDLMNQPVTTARGEDAPPVENARSYAFAAGFQKHRVGFEAGLQLHDVESESFSMDPNTPPFVMSTASAELRLRWLEAMHIASDMHFGPAAGLVFDKRAMDKQFGEGFRVGISLGAQLGPINAFADLYTIDMMFGAGPAEGTSQITGLTLGIALR